MIHEGVPGLNLEVAGSIEMSANPGAVYPAWVQTFEKRELCDLQSPAAVYARERVALLCGDEYDVPEVYVVKGEAINALATPGVIAINEGTFEGLEYAEELDALLAHELQHLFRGHACRRQDLPDQVQMLGSRRAGEIEADILGMQLLDKRGINPAGMISMVDRFARHEAEEAAEAQGKRKNKDTVIYSPAHGNSLDRKITLEQALTVIDTKHLSADLQPLARLSVGDTITMRDEAFWQLAPEVQQGLLGRELNEERGYTYISDRHLATQTRILQTARRLAGAPQEEDAVVRRKASLLLSVTRAGIRLKAENPTNLSELQHDLRLLDSEDVTTLMSAADRRARIEDLMAPALKSAVLDNAAPVEDVLEMARIANERDITTIEPAEMEANADETEVLTTRYEGVLSTVLAPNALQQLDPANQMDAVEKIARFAAATRTDFRTLSSFVVAAESPFPAHAAPELNRQLLGRTDKYRLQAIAEKVDLADKLRFIATMTARSNMTDYFEWGLSTEAATAVAVTQDGEIIIGPFAESINAQLSALSTKEISGLVLDLAARGENPQTVGKVARLTYDMYTKSTARRLNFALYVGHDFDSGGRTHDVNAWKNFLPVAILAGECLVEGGSEPSLEEMISLSVIPRNTFRGEADTGVRNSAMNTANRFKEVRKAFEYLEQAYPDLLSRGIVAITEDETLVKEALLYGALVRFPTYPAAATRELISIMHDHSVERLQVGDLYRTEQDLQPMNKLWRRAVEALLADPNWAEDEQKLLALAGLGMAAPEIEVNLAVPAHAFERVARLRDFEGGLRLLDEFPTMRLVHPAILNVLIEEKARTADDFERLNQLIEKEYADIIADNFGLIGTGAIIDSIAIPFYSGFEAQERKVGIKTDVVPALESTKLLTALLSTGHDEGPLKQYAAERWWFEKRTSLDAELQGHFRIEDYLTYRTIGTSDRSRQARLLHWLQHDYPEDGTYAPFTSVVNNLYLQTGPGRFAATRKLLLSDQDGVLMDAQRSEALVDALMQSWLATEEGSDEAAMMRDMLHDLLVANDPATAYLHVGPMIQDMILKPPKDPADIAHTTKAIADNVFRTLVAQGKLKNPTDIDYRVLQHRVHRLFIAQSAEQFPLVEEIEATKQRLLAAFGIQDSGSETQKMSTISFAALAGKKAGALGNKMLQLGGQYFELSEEEEEEFSDVYDDRVGQSRLQAYNAFKREAQENEVVAQLFNSVSEFGERIGGGSLFTVYRMMLNDGREVTLGVQNPNAEYRVARLTEFAATGLTQTVDKHPTSTNLQLMLSLLNDGGRWIQNELHDPDFHYKNQVFTAQNDTRVGQGFKQGRSRYHLATPQALDTRSQRIRSEEVIHGQNLTKIKIRDDQPTDIPAGIIHTDDYRDVVSLLVRDYVYQTSVGDFAHSDIHPGNFRITDDNSTLMVLDRYNLIPMHDQLRQTLKTAFTTIMTGNLQGAAMTIASYATNDAQAIERFKAAMQADAAAQDAPAKFVANTILALKREGIEVPLDLSLLLRDFMSLSKLSTRAGFSNLAEAFMHTSYGVEELAPLLG